MRLVGQKFTKVVNRQLVFSKKGNYSRINLRRAGKFIDERWLEFYLRQEKRVCIPPRLLEDDRSGKL